MEKSGTSHPKLEEDTTKEQNCFQESTRQA